jgi:hypothetical protein
LSREILGTGASVESRRVAYLERQPAERQMEVTGMYEEHIMALFWPPDVRREFSFNPQICSLVKLSAGTGRRSPLPGTKPMFAERRNWNCTAVLCFVLSACCPRRSGVTIGGLPPKGFA